MPSIQEVIYQIQERLKPIAGDLSRLEARLLVQKALGLDLTGLISRGPEEFPQTKWLELETWIQRRLHQEPLSKIFGEREFYGRLFTINAHVLDPRADSEILIEEALKLLPPLSPYKIMDAGTGSGCLLLSLLAERPESQGIALDVSDHALETTVLNAQNLGLEKNLQTLQASMLNPEGVALRLKTMAGFDEGLDLLISNPPYIPQREIQDLSPGVRLFDPPLALDGGEDGLEFYRALATLANGLLKKHGYCVIEIGQGQEKDVEAIFESTGLGIHHWQKDLSGIVRCGVFSLKQ